MSSKDAKALATGFIGLGTGLVGGDVYYQRRAMKEQRKAQRSQERLAEFKANNEKRKQIRQAVALRAQVENQAAQTGTSTSSGVAGGVAGIQQQAYGNIFAIDTSRAYGRDISRSLDNAASFTSKAQTVQQARNVAMTIFSGFNPGAGAGGGAGAAGAGSGPVGVPMNLTDFGGYS